MPSTGFVLGVVCDAIGAPCSIGIPSKPTCWVAVVEVWAVEVGAAAEDVADELEELELPQPASSSAQAAAARR
jgi:hypothetical protein